VIRESIWGYDYYGASNVVEVYVRHLRQKLEANGEPPLLHTVRGVGYKADEAE
jgi:two-component system response regulator MprA